ncbi:MAG: RNA-binding S4 domain-containing protein [Verrucomicrobiales bacterium]|nr:RNA-binding S4 domain-containing protein [Verrucomicrobiales bacterium]
MPTDPDTLRADQWLHHTRIFKSRSLAAQACQKGNVTLQGGVVKASRVLKVGDVLTVRRGELELVLRVLACPARRVGAPLVAGYCGNETPPESYARAAAAREQRRLEQPNPLDRATRPNKQQLRQLREWWDQQAES